MSAPKHHFVTANGLRHHVVEQGEGPMVLLLHGFPEGWYSWRHQLAALSAAGFRAVAPDARGYGETDAPAEVRAYDTATHVADAAELLDALGARTAVVVGHDWGAVTAWRAALTHPERFPAIAALSVPFSPRAPAPPLAIFRKRFAGTFFYMLYFQEPGVAEAELETETRTALRRFYCAASGDAGSLAGFIGKPPGARLLDGMPDPAVLPAWLTEADLDVYAAGFARHGFRGPLNRYRNVDRDWDTFGEVVDRTVRVPAMFVTGDKDLAYVFAPESIAGMKDHVPSLREPIVLPGGGHWIQQERPAETSAALLAFLADQGAS